MCFKAFRKLNKETTFEQNWNYMRCLNFPNVSICYCSEYSCPNIWFHIRFPLKPSQNARIWIKKRLFSCHKIPVFFLNHPWLIPPPILKWDELSWIEILAMCVWQAITIFMYWIISMKPYFKSLLTATWYRPQDNANCFCSLFLDIFDKWSSRGSTGSTTRYISLSVWNKQDILNYISMKSTENLKSFKNLIVFLIKVDFKLQIYKTKI